MIQISEHITLRSHTTFKTGGAAQFFVRVTSEAELAEAVAYARAHELPLTILGGGSNVLVSDAGVLGLVVQMAIMGVEAHEEGDVVLLTVGAGETFDDVVARAVAHGYCGLENLSYIPGTVGATPVQNVGAYGVEVRERISLVRVYDTELETFTVLAASECEFGYRDSIFKHEAGKRYVVSAVTFMLTKKFTPQLEYKDLAVYFAERTPTLAEIREAVIVIRSKKFPDWQTVGTAGSFFKNPIITRTHYDLLLQTYPELPSYSVDDAHVKVPLGWILDQVLKLKGQGTDTVGCFAGQALVLYTKDDTTTAEVLAFAEDIIAAVYALTQIAVEKEVTLLV